MDDGCFLPPTGDGERKEASLVCADADFDTAMEMVRVLLRHSASVFQSLPRRTERRFRQGRQQRTEGSRQALLSALPDTFNRAAYLQAAAQMGIGEKTAERYIGDLCRSGMLEHPANGQYRKTS